MEKELKLVSNGGYWYVSSAESYAIMLEMKVPVVKVSRDNLPLLKQRCKQYGHKVSVREFSELERSTVKNMNKIWRYNIELKTGGVEITFPKEKTEKAKDLVRKFQAYYERHMHDVDVQVKKYPTNIRVFIERKFNGKRSPEWKAASHHHSVSGKEGSSSN